MRGIELYLVTVDSPMEEPLFEYLLGFVGDERRERVLRQKIKQNSDNMLTGEILAKVAIKKTFGIEIAKQKFVCTEHGKPYLQGYPDVHFSISHSGKSVACAVSGNPIGVDIQTIGTYNPSVAKRVCNDAELAQIEAACDTASEFTKLWTRKEAVLKMLGVGIAGGDIKHCLAHHDVSSERLGDAWVSVCKI